MGLMERASEQCKWEIWKKKKKFTGGRNKDGDRNANAVKLIETFLYIQSRLTSFRIDHDGAVVRPP